MVQEFTVPDWIGSVSLGTGTVQTLLSGDKSGNATNYVVPAWCQATLACAPKITISVPTAAQTVLATLKFQSNDMNFGNFEVFAEPLQAILGATSTLQSNNQFYNTYVMNAPVSPGNQIQAYGQAQIANTGAGLRLGSTIWISNLAPPGPQCYSLLTSKANNTNNPTAGPTAAATVLGQSITISGGSGASIFSTAGILTSRAYAITDNEIGYFQLSAPELQQPIRWGMDPEVGALGATGAARSAISRADQLSANIDTPSTITTSLIAEGTVGAAGLFEMGVMYN